MSFHYQLSSASSERPWLWFQLLCLRSFYAFAVHTQDLGLPVGSCVANQSSVLSSMIMDHLVSVIHSEIQCLTSTDTSLSFDPTSYKLSARGHGHGHGSSQVPPTQDLCLPVGSGTAPLSHNLPSVTRDTLVSIIHSKIQHLAITKVSPVSPSPPLPLPYVPSVLWFLLFACIHCVFVCLISVLCLVSDFPLMELALCCFVTFLVQAGLSYSSIKLYLCALRHHQLLDGGGGPSFTSFHHYILRGAPSSVCH